ncbi:MAG: hypothetical protein WCI01_05490 [Chlorobiaceae bacterium]
MKVRSEKLKNQEKSSSLLLYLAFVFIVFGAKAIIISNFGSSIPFWDQWDAQADSLYRPWLLGSRHWMDLFASHNEHRIFTTRALSLLLLYLNKGVWDPMFEMYVNAMLHTVALLFLLFLMQKGLERGTKFAFFFFASLLFAVPFGYENTLAGFQSQFYFLLLFSFIFLWAIIQFHTAPKRWFPVLVFSALLSFFSLASGALTIAAGVGTLVIRWLCGIQRTRATLLLIILLSLACAAAIYFTPIIPRHAALKAKSLLDFVIDILRATGGGLLYFPVVLFLIRHFQNIRSATGHSWFVVALCLWVTGQIFAIAYGRSSWILTSRYLDLFAIGILLNGYCLLFMLQGEESVELLINKAFIWFVFVAACLGLIFPSMIKAIESKNAACLRNEDNVRGYLTTRDYTFLQKAPYEEIPYDDAVRLKSLLDNKTISSILTPAVNSNNTRNGLGFYGKTSRTVFSVIGSFLLFTGIGLFMAELIKSYLLNKGEECP